MRGIVQSGGTSGASPLADVTVALFCAKPTGPVLVKQTPTGRDGIFAFDIAPPPDGIYYVRAYVHPDVTLMTVIGETLPETITVNELTTVAGVYCMAQFLSVGGAIGGDPFGVGIATRMIANLVSITDGTSSAVITSSPNGDETNTLRSTRALANVLAACVIDPLSACRPFFEAATPSGQPTPTDTIDALRNVALFPASHAGAIYALSKTIARYAPSLEQQPDAWTLAVKVNDSGDPQRPFGGPGNLAFDRRGNAWILNNVVQGTPNSCDWSIILGPDGKPAVDASGRSLSPISGGGILGPGYGIVYSQSAEQYSDDLMYIGNFGWGDLKPNPGSISLFNAPDATAITPAQGFTNATLHVQGMALDRLYIPNVWMASYGNDSVVVYRQGNPDNYATFQRDGLSPFDVAIAADNTAWVTSSNPAASGILHLSLSSSGLSLVKQTMIGRTMKGIVIDGAGNIWTGSGGNDHVYAFDGDGNVLGGFQGGGINGPWGVCLDGNDDVWVANFGPLEMGSVFTGRVTKLAGYKSTSAHVLLGDALTPPSGYTLPSAGAEVLLNDGTPLYGPNGPACYTPMMRTTGLNVDAAGNVWTCNNWKPDFDNDTAGGNPGGDGMIIFIGVATPRAV